MANTGAARVKQSWGKKQVNEGIVRVDSSRIFKDRLYLYIFYLFTKIIFYSPSMIKIELHKVSR